MKGYSSLAWRMSHYPEFAIFRNFNTLRLQNLLYLQAELTQLETRLQEASEKNGNSVVQHEQWAARDWQHLSRADPISGEPNKQWEIFLLIREKLKEYDAARVQLIETSNLTPPSSHNLSLFKSNYDNPDSEDYLLGADRTIWSDASLSYDLISLKPPPAWDFVTGFLVKYLLSFYHDYIGRRTKSSPDVDSGLFNYREEHLQRPIKVFNVVLSSLLPVLSIVILYLVPSMSVKLGLIALFTALFSSIVALTTNAKSGEIFAGTAAFAAVQVVFIGTNNPPAPS